MLTLFGGNDHNIEISQILFEMFGIVFGICFIYGSINVMTHMAIFEIGVTLAIYYFLYVSMVLMKDMKSEIE